MKKRIKVLVARILATFSHHDCWSQCKHFSTNVYFQWLNTNPGTIGVVVLFFHLLLSLYIFFSYNFFFFFFHSIDFLNCLFECILSYVFTVSCNLYKKNHSQKEKKKERVAVKYLLLLKVCSVSLLPSLYRMKFPPKNNKKSDLIGFLYEIGHQAFLLLVRLS